MGISAVKPVLKQGGRSLKNFCYGLRAFLGDVWSRETLLERIATLKLLFPIRRGWERPPLPWTAVIVRQNPVAVVV